MKPKYCLYCGYWLSAQVEGHPSCGGCGKYVHWNNPAPCVAVLLPVLKLNRNVDVLDHAEPNAIVLVQRGIEPHKGQWCLPCGFVDANEDPWDAAKRESEEEAKAKIEFVQILDATMPNKQLNQLIIFYMARLVDGGLEYGSDAAGIGWFKKDELPDIAFDSHKQVIEDYFNGRWKYTGNLSARIRLN